MKKKLVLALVILFIGLGKCVSAQPFLTCDPLPTTPAVEYYLITGSWTGIISVPVTTDPCKFDLALAPIGINIMTISACSTNGCSFPKEFTLYKTKGWAFTKDRKTYTMKEQWIIREGGVLQ